MWCGVLFFPSGVKLTRIHKNQKTANSTTHFIHHTHTKKNMDNRDVNQIPDVVDGEDSDVIYAEDIEFGDDDIEFIEEFQDDDDDDDEGEDYEDGMGDDDEEEGPIEDNSIARFAEHTG